MKQVFSWFYGEIEKAPIYLISNSGMTFYTAFKFLKKIQIEHATCACQQVFLDHFLWLGNINIYIVNTLSLPYTFTMSRKKSYQFETGYQKNQPTNLVGKAEARSVLKLRFPSKFLKMCGVGH